MMMTDLSVRADTLVVTWTDGTSTLYPTICCATTALPGCTRKPMNGYWIC